MILDASILPPADAARAAALMHEIATLREAHACITDSATPAVIYGRVDSLINARQDELLGIFQQAQGAVLSEVNLRA